jgi:hypothetical protein
MRPLNGIIPKALIGRRNRVGLLYQAWFKAILVERESHLLELCRLYRAYLHGLKAVSGHKPGIGTVTGQRLDWLPCPTF